MVIKLDKIDCEWSNFSVAKELLEEFVLEDYQCYPEQYLGEEPEGWFTSEEPHKLYGIKFSREDIRELAREMCKADRNVPIDTGYTDWNKVFADHWDNAKMILLRKIEEKKHKQYKKNIEVLNEILVEQT